MATSSYYRLPRLHTYAQALNHYSKTAPIRGRSPEVRPLGARKDVDKFKIDKLENGDVACVLYNTPLVTFHPDDSITVYLGTYRVSLCDTYFLQQLLGINASIQRRALVIGYGEWKQVLNTDNPRVTLVRTEGVDARGLMPKDAPVVRGWQIDRPAATLVRGKYKEFYRYVKAALSLRKEMHYDKEYVEVSAYELKGALPYTCMTPEMLAEAKTGVRHYWAGLDPTKVSDPMTLWTFEKSQLLNNPLDGKTWDYQTAAGPLVNMRQRDAWYESMNKFMQLVSTEGKDEDQQATDHYHAFLWLTFWAAAGIPKVVPGGGLSNYISRIGYWTDDEHASKILYRTLLTTVRNAVDALLFMWHSDEVLKYEPLKPGQVPNPRYSKWVNK